MVLVGGPSLSVAPLGVSIYCALELRILALYLHPVRRTVESLDICIDLN